jgi:hypothetical protein
MRARRRDVDTLAAMHRRGSITTGMRDAGGIFRGYFRTAQLDPLKAADMTRLPSAARFSSSRSAAVEAARDVVWRAIQAAGGLGSPGGSCLWHVVGAEHSIKQWALEQGWSGRTVSPETGSGILIAALGILEQHLEERR